MDGHGRAFGLVRRIPGATEELRPRSVNMSLKFRLLQVHGRLEPDLSPRRGATERFPP